VEKNIFQYFSIIFLGICIILGAWIISRSLYSSQSDSIPEECFRYDLISVNDNNIIIFDKQSGEYWRKYIESNEGPTEWEKQESPINAHTN
jgi:hypothetical protein